jgi:hypothetical protein
LLQPKGNPIKGTLLSTHRQIIYARSVDNSARVTNLLALKIAANLSAK